MDLKKPIWEVVKTKSGRRRRQWNFYSLDIQDVFPVELKQYRCFVPATLYQKIFDSIAGGGSHCELAWRRANRRMYVILSIERDLAYIIFSIRLKGKHRRWVRDQAYRRYLMSFKYRYINWAYTKRIADRYRNPFATPSSDEKVHLLNLKNFKRRRKQ